MKLRTGFVSNSSSSSFVVLLPEAFDPDTFDLSSVRDDIVDDLGVGDEDTDEIEDAEKSVRKNLKRIMRGDMIWIDEDEGGRATEMLFYPKAALAKYILATFDGSSGCGQILGLKREAVKKILAETA